MQKNISAILECLLFAAGDPIEKSQLAQIIGISEQELESEADKLQKFYDDNERGFKIIAVEDCLQLCTKSEYYPFIQAITLPKRKQNLSPAAMEALSIVAYHQPVTKSSIEYIRGVNSDGPVNTLIERGLIEESGRLEAPGRPILYATTQEFLRSFGIRTINDLPDVMSIFENKSGDNITENESE